MGLLQYSSAGYWHIGNNSWDRLYFRYAQALEASKSMINCSGCIDCERCVDCIDCTKCTDCIDCVDFIHERDYVAFSSCINTAEEEAIGNIHAFQIVDGELDYDFIYHNIPFVTTVARMLLSI